MRRVSLKLKVTADLKAALEVSARVSGRSQSREAEFRLEQSFAAESLRCILREEIAAAFAKLEVACQRG
jgi:hypothetical protein